MRQPGRGSGSRARPAGAVRILRTAARSPIPPENAGLALETPPIRPISMDPLDGRGARHLLSVVVVVIGLGQVKRHFRSVQDGSIQKLIESSRVHEAAGRLGEALIDLDVALNLASKRESSDPTAIEEQKSRRGELARRDARTILDQLVRRSTSLPLGDWLNIIARARRDTDLAPLRSLADEQFRLKVRQQADSDLASARKSLESGRVVVSLQTCDRIAKLLVYLPPDVQCLVRPETEGLVGRLLETHGVVVEAPKGEFVFGSQETYLSKMLPTLLDAVEAKGYLPNRSTSPWAGLWSKALYRLRFEVSERLEGNYLSSENRLTRIEARLTFTSRNSVIWQTFPTARTNVPLPRLAGLLVGAIGRESRTRRGSRATVLRQCTRPDRRKVRLCPEQHASLSLPVGSLGCRTPPGRWLPAFKKRLFGIPPRRITWTDSDAHQKAILGHGVTPCNHWSQELAKGARFGVV